MIKFEGLTKRFKSTEAVSELRLTIEDKEIFGLLGPNGAGKTTTLLMLCSIMKPTKGTIILNGINIVQNPDEGRRNLGIAFQEPVLDSRLTVEQNLEFHAEACRLTRTERRERIDAILGYLDMSNSRKQKVGSLSGGMKKKIENAKIFIQRPPIAIFDEPTAYLDVPSRHRVWKEIENLKQGGSTVILATNMMDEAERLANRLGILTKGKLVAMGTTGYLKDSIPQGDVIDLQVTGDPTPVAQIIRQIERVREVVIVPQTNRLRIYLAQAELRLPEIMETLIGKGTRVESIAVREPSLDDVFLHYAGEAL